MQIPEVGYHRPRRLEEVFDLVDSLGDGALFLAGGTELVPDLKRGRSSARHLVSLKGVPALAEIHADEEFLHVGAMATLAGVAGSATVAQAYPALSEAAGMIGCAQIREQGTIGGNFCGAVPCADTPPACIVGKGSVRILSREGERHVLVEDFFLGPRETVLEPGEILAEVCIPVAPRTGFGAAYERFGLRRGMAVAVASVAAAVWLAGETIREARIALGAVAPVPLPAVESGKLLAGELATAEIIGRAAETAAGEARPICDLRGSDGFRREIVEVLTRRALAGAVLRAGGAVR